MARRPSSAAALTRAYQRNVKALTKATLQGGQRLAGQLQRVGTQHLAPPPGRGDWIGGMALGPAGARGYHLYRPPDLKLLPGERLPLLVMLHGCGQTGRDFAVSTRMDRLAAQHRFLVLYPEQDRLANAQGCWNWFDRRSGKADAEAATLMTAVDQVCLLYRADRERVAVAGLSAGASMAALLATRYPVRFKAVAMHSGVAPGAAKSPVTALGAMRGQHPPAILATAVGKAMGAAALFTTLPPLLVLQGDADDVVAPGNAQDSATIWAAATGAVAGKPRVLKRGKRYPMRVTDYRKQGHTCVTLCQIAQLGHAWSGGAARAPFSDPAGPDASRLVWVFAARQFTAAARA